MPIRRKAKSGGFEKVDEELARYAKMLSAPAKVAILKTLAERNECICGEIVDITPLAQSTVSQHLKELKELGLIQGTIAGATSCYCIDPAGFEKCRGVFEAFFEGISALKRSCVGKK